MPDRAADDTFLGQRLVSNTRASPNLLCSPSVTRCTPPLRPTSSPNTTTFGIHLQLARECPANGFGEPNHLADVLHRIEPPSAARSSRESPSIGLVGRSRSAYTKRPTVSASGARTRTRAFQRRRRRRAPLLSRALTIRRPKVVRERGSGEGAASDRASCPPRSRRRCDSRADCQGPNDCTCAEPSAEQAPGQRHSARVRHTPRSAARIRLDRFHRRCE